MVEVGRFDTRTDAEFARSLLATARIPCVLVPDESAGAFPLDLHREAGFGCLDDDFVVQAQREAQAVEPRTEVGAGRCDDSGGRQPGRQSPSHRSHPLDQTQLLDDG